MSKENRASGEAQTQSKAKSVLVAVCAVLVAVLVIGLTVFTRLDDSGAILRNTPAVESENFEVSGTMMAYYFNTTYQSYASIISYLGVDTSVSLKAQPCSYINDGNGTWFDYFVALAEANVTEMLALCEAAKAAGMSVDDVDKTVIDSTIEELKAAAEAYGYTLDQYLTAAMGTGMKEKDIREALELNSLATLYYNEYYDSLTYTDEQLEAYYSANTADFDGVDYLVFTTAAADFMAADTNGNPVGDTTESSATAKAEADKLAAAASEDEFLSLVREYLTATGADEETIESSVNSCYQRHVLAADIAAVSDWAFSASAGETNVAGADGDTSFTVYYLTKSSYRDETTNRNVRHILFSNDTYEDSSAADEVFAEWEAAGFTDEKFEELVTAYSDDTGSVDNGGVYENVAQGEMTNTFNAWLFDGSRKLNDKGVIESDYGWHIMEYLGEAENTAWESNAMYVMKQDDCTALIESYSENINYDYETIYKINA